MDFERLAQKYTGSRAREYNEKRTSAARWATEQTAISELLQCVPRGIRVLDLPVGTGRVFPFYKQLGARVTGVDISPDMLATAEEYAAELQFDVDLRDGDIRAIPFGDGTFDLVTCIRFLNWIDLEGVKQSLSELTRVCRDKLLIAIRHKARYTELRPRRRDLVRFVHLVRGEPEARQRRNGIVYHTRPQISRVFRDLGLDILETRQTDWRRDGTDYVLYLLQRRRS